MKVLRIVKRNLNYIGKTWIKCMGIFTTLLSTFFVFWTWEDVNVDKNWVKFLIIGLAIFLSLLYSALWICCLRNEKTIWKSVSGEIRVRYSDIFEEISRANCTQERLFVIPVNSCFDTIVDEDISVFAKPLVSSNSLHGQWIKMMADEGKLLTEINQEIENSLCKQKVKKERNIPKEDKARGNLTEYPLGTIAAVRGRNKCTYLLLALTRFDSNNSACTTVDEMEDCVKSLINFYTTYGQGHEIVVPLIGTHLSRTGLTHEDSLKIIILLFRLYGDRIQGRVNVVIYTGDRDKVSLDV